MENILLSIKLYINIEKFTFHEIQYICYCICSPSLCVCLPFKLISNIAVIIIYKEKNITNRKIKFPCVDILVQPYHIYSDHRYLFIHVPMCRYKHTYIYFFLYFSLDYIGFFSYSISISYFSVIVGCKSNEAQFVLDWKISQINEMCQFCNDCSSVEGIY